MVALARPRAWESRRSNAGLCRAVEGLRSALWTSPSRRLLQPLGRLFYKRTKEGVWECGGSPVSPSIPSTREWPHSTHTQSLQRGERKREHADLGKHRPRQGMGLSPHSQEHPRPQGIIFSSSAPGSATTHCHGKLSCGH